MSMTLVGRSDDLSRLVAERFDIEIRQASLLVHHVPYVTPAGTVDYCILHSELTTNGEQTVTPGRHEVWVIGEIPHDHQGNKLSIVIEEGEIDCGNGLVATCRLSGKLHNEHPPDYYIKISNTVRVLGQYARGIEPGATHTDAPPREASPDESVFIYQDTASSRSLLSAVTDKLKMPKVAIVGLGGTGSFILDLVAKTPAGEIHLFDDDEFLAHNAFRAPGAASLDDVKPMPKKVEYFASIYSRFRRSIVPHAERIDENNVNELRDMSFVFLSMDAGPAKKLIIDHLREWKLPFVDCGMGLTRVENSLRGTVRVTSGSTGRYDHVERRVSFGDITADEYDLNMQTADLNMLNAAMAVIRWKKFCGYYSDSGDERHTAYVVSSNVLVSAEVPDAE
jgi:hypothetical protein